MVPQDQKRAAAALQPPWGCSWAPTTPLLGKTPILELFQTAWGGWVLPDQLMWIASRRINAEKERFLLSLHACAGAVTRCRELSEPPADLRGHHIPWAGANSPRWTQPNTCVQLFYSLSSPKNRVREGRQQLSFLSCLFLPLLLRVMGKFLFSALGQTKTDVLGQNNKPQWLSPSSFPS